MCSDGIIGYGNSEGRCLTRLNCHVLRCNPWQWELRGKVLNTLELSCAPMESLAMGTQREGA